MNQLDHETLASIDKSAPFGDIVDAVLDALCVANADTLESDVDDTLFNRLAARAERIAERIAE